MAKAGGKLAGGGRTAGGLKSTEVGLFTLQKGVFTCETTPAS